MPSTNRPDVPTAVPTSALSSVEPTDTAGRTTISSLVVQKIAALSTREVAGVHALGGGVSRAIGAIRDRIPGSGATSTAGVAVEVGEKQAAIDLDVVVEYGARIAEVARDVRRNVITSVEQITGLEVIEVNIAVNDIHLPGEEDEPESSRVE
ncbi:putative alkaline shock family protein YloU [Amycolatopsis echigonensis]|uniref:Alkaline shock family protein YloU n=1 Tax=Amycolatopsis echigonensis TaxID=2576905 RepID=A0A2N3W956_9PSEU|nr:Asp23/Gls24 family envelope stress response protein [Amycolatopsis niigatensis]PKV90408.1 putative alkaline shock family protein YloU [Amycolatopsis niigatensis]